jgi:hypothetical protein
MQLKQLQVSQGGVLCDQQLTGQLVHQLIMLPALDAEHAGIGCLTWTAAAAAAAAAS